MKIISPKMTLSTGSHCFLAISRVKNIAIPINVNAIFEVRNQSRSECFNRASLSLGFSDSSSAYRSDSSSFQLAKAFGSSSFHELEKGSSINSLVVSK